METTNSLLEMLSSFDIGDTQNSVVAALRIVLGLTIFIWGARRALSFFR